MPSTSFQDIETAIKTWGLNSIAVAHQVGGRAAITVDGKTTVYPMWLALRQVNLLGVERGV